MRWMTRLGMALFVFAVFLSASAIAQSATAVVVGKFECRDWNNTPTTLIAVLALHRDGSYEATDRVEDLNAHRPSTSGQYRYDKDRQRIDWTSGRWNDRIGTYTPHLKGTDFVIIHTKRDPEGKVDQGISCARTSAAP